MEVKKDGRSVNFPQILSAADLCTVPSPCSPDTASLSSLETLSDVPSDIIIKSRIQYGSRWSACMGLLIDYSKETTIHGIRYIFEVHRPFYEKLYWTILLIASGYFAVSLIWATFMKWQDSPVILGFDETLVPVHKIPFPTITICPEIKMDQEMFDFTNVSRGVEANGLGNLTEEEISQFAATLHICEEEVVRKFGPLIPPGVLPDVSKRLVDLTISKNQTAPFCKWNGRFYFCDKILNFVATDEGICYQFNGLQNKDLYRDERYVSYSDDQIVDYNNYFDPLPPLNNITGNWSLDDGYRGQGYNAYPQRTIFSSARNAFFAFLQGFSHNFEYACRSFKQGYKVYLNSPESAPLTTGNYILVPHGFEVLVTVLPQYVQATQNLHDYSPAKRQCYFNDERYLRFFRFYSQSNCQTECLANFTITKCGCAKFWMPKPLDVPTCGLADFECYTQAQESMNLIIQNQTQQKSVNPETAIMCDCMPSCTSLEYNVEISRSVYDLAKTLEALREVYEHSDFLGSRLSVYFKEHQFTAIKRTVLFSISTLIANCGGILGLFMGISSLSFIELVYFCSVRLVLNLRKRRLAKKKIQKLEAGHEN